MKKLLEIICISGIHKYYKNMTIIPALLKPSVLFIFCFALAVFPARDTFGVPSHGVSIGDLVWNDLNMNGLQDPGEPGVSGINISMVYDLYGSYVPLGSTITDLNGNYLFEIESFNANVHYYLQFTLPDYTWAFTLAKQGMDPTIDSDVTSQISYLVGMTDSIFPAGNLDLTYDAGIYRSGAPVPEPSTIVLMGLGMVGLAGIGIKRLFKI